MTQKKNLGNAGEFYVLAQLAQRGYVAGKTDDGQTLIDVIATDPETLSTVNIQVKATGTKGKVPSWIMSAKNELVFKSLWYVLVLIAELDQLPTFYVFHSSEIGEWLLNF
jgi:Holliday junction resolvase-like predicted endonuclease